MNGQLEVVKQEMARGNIDILGISGLRWTLNCYEARRLSHGYC